MWKCEIRLPDASQSPTTLRMQSYSDYCDPWQRFMVEFHKQQMGLLASTKWIWLLHKDNFMDFFSCKISFSCKTNIRITDMHYTNTDIHYCLGLIEVRKMQQLTQKSGSADWLTPVADRHLLMPHCSITNNCMQTNSPGCSRNIWTTMNFINTNNRYNKKQGVIRQIVMKFYRQLQYISICTPFVARIYSSGTHVLSNCVPTFHHWPLLSWP